MKLIDFQETMRMLAGETIRVTQTDGRVFEGVCTGTLLSTKVGRRKEIVRFRAVDVAKIETI